MKSFLFVIIVVLSASLSSAQNNAPYIYCDFGMGTGSFNSYKIGLTSWVGERHSIGIYFHRHWRNGKEVPDDYTDGRLRLNLFFPIRVMRSRMTGCHLVR